MFSRPWLVTLLLLAACAIVHAATIEVQAVSLRFDLPSKYIGPDVTPTKSQISEITRLLKNDCDRLPRSYPADEIGVIDIKYSKGTGMTELSMFFVGNDELTSTDFVGDVRTSFDEWKQFHNGSFEATTIFKLVDKGTEPDAFVMPAKRCGSGNYVAASTSCPSSSSGGNNAGKIAGGVIGALLGVGVIVGAAVYYRQRSNASRGYAFSLSADGGLESTYEPPVTLPYEHDDLPPDWSQCTDDHGNIYYYNSRTDKSQWERPTR